jgi:DNA-binding transcriptional LysR family regulator
MPAAPGAPHGALRGTLPSVSLAQIEYFVAVAEEGQVGRAARKLHVAQPAVSRQIRKLEKELRVPLLLRTSRGMRLPEPGAVFLGHARQTLGGIEAARGAVLRATTLDEPDRGPCKGLVERLERLGRDGL